jgi:hypothetical protein
MKGLMIDSDRIVFLLTSTQEPYLRDALDLMFYPSGVEYRFRYDKKWLSPELKSSDGRISNENVKKLVGMKALLIFILTEKKNDQYLIHEFLPIREATIHDAKPLGEFLWLGFILGDWVVYHQESLEGEVNEHNEALKSHIPKNSREVVKQLVIFAEKPDVETIPEEFTGGSEDVLNNWTIIAGHMSRFSRVLKQKLIFTKLVSLREIDNNAPICAKLIDSNQRGFELKAGRSYSMDIAEYCGQKVEPFEIKIKTQEDKIAPIIDRVEVRGKYDRLQFMINCKEVRDTCISALSLEPPVIEDYLISKPMLQLKIKVSRWRNVWLPLLLFAFSTFITSEQLLQSFVGQPINYLLLGISALGTIGSTISLLLLKT